MSALPFKYREVLSPRMISDSPEEHPETLPSEALWTGLEHLGITVPLDSRKRLLVQPYDELQQQPDTYTITDDEREEGNFEIITYRYPRTASPSLEFLLGAMAEAMGFDRSFDVYTPHPTKALDDKIDAFLRNHTGIDYRSFAQQINARAIEQNDYGSLPSRFRRKLFNFRATVYLAALASAEERGYALPLLLEELAKAKVIPLKKEIEEPTFSFIKKQLQTS